MNASEKLIDLLRARHAAVLANHGITTDQTDLTPEQWAQYALDEMDVLRRDKARLDELERMITSCAVLTYYSEKGRAEFLHGASGDGCVRQFLDGRIEARKGKA